MIRLLLVLMLLPLTAWAEVPPAEWPAFPVIMWQGQAASRVPGLRAMGVTGFNRGRSSPPGGPATPYYVENIATDFYAPYHRWLPDRPVTALFDSAKARHRADPGDLGVFIREPSLSDSAALLRTTDRLRAVVAAHRVDRPLFYNLGDETGIADLAAAWDFDLSPASLDGLRDWLRGRYGTLEALNQEWGASYGKWEDVRPELTTAATARTDRNWSAWADFKAWMDEAFVRAVRAGADAVHAADPGALAGLEGAQVPGWGGYDYGRLSDAVDVMEIYDSAANIDIALSLNPRLIVLTTSFGSGPGETRRLWRDRLRGTRGLVLWDEEDTVVRDDGSPGPRGRADGALWRDLAGPEAVRFAAGEVRPDGVAVLYSQASFRTQWMLDHAAAGERWTERDAEREGEDTPWRASLRGVQSALAHLALTPRWTTPDRLAATLAEPGVRVLLLPHAVALGDGELAAIAAFRTRGGRVFADVAPGAFDAHSRRRDRAPDAVAEVVGAWPADQAGLDRMAAVLPPAPVTLRHGAGRAADIEAYVRWTGPMATVGLMPDDGLDRPVDVSAPGPVRSVHAAPAILAVDPAPP